MCLLTSSLIPLGPFIPPFYLFYLLYLDTPSRCWGNPVGAWVSVGLACVWAYVQGFAALGCLLVWRRWPWYPLSLLGVKVAPPWVSPPQSWE